MRCVPASGTVAQDSPPRERKNRTISAVAHFPFIKAYVSSRIEISPEALPFRPATGMYIAMACIPGTVEHRDVRRWCDEVYVPRMVEVPGVMGAYWFGIGRPHIASLPIPDDCYAWIYYLDDDPVRVANAINATAEDLNRQHRGMSAKISPVLSGPYRTIVDPLNYDWNKQV